MTRRQSTGAAKATPYILAGVLAAALVVHAQAPQATQPVFRSSTDLVTIDVTVTTSGTPVAGLRASDFVLTDNGVPQALEVVALEAVPATVTIILDIGDFMRETIKSFVDDVRKIAEMVRPGDEVRLMAIDTYVHDLVPLRAAAAWPRIDRFTTNGLASAHDALAAAMMRQHDPNRQHLIIAMTNGVDTGSVLDINALTEIARRSSASLHIVPADLELEDIGPPKRYSTRRERGMGVDRLGRTKRRFWMPFHDREFVLQEQAANLTGGSWQLPGMFVNRGASVIFENFYKTHRRSYRLTYTPKGVAREGWHAVSVTVPKFPSYSVGARPGYSIELPRPVPPRPSADKRGEGAIIEALVAAYDRDSGPAFDDALRQVGDFEALIKAFEEGGNPWPDRPRREAAFVLELAHAALVSGQRAAFVPAQKLLDQHRLLVRDPLGPDAFERYWLWTAAAILQTVSANAVSEQFLTASLARYPDEPRLLLARAFALDRRVPFSWGAGTATTVIAPQFSGGTSIPARVSVISGLPQRHVREVAEAYDAAMVSTETSAEARIRKALLLYRAGRAQEALALLEYTGPPPSDAVLRYYRDLFRGSVMAALDLDAEAEAAYRAAQALAPMAQSPRVALMALALNRGNAAAGAAMAEEIQLAPADAWDPWWNYWEGDYRLVTAALARLRAQTR